MSRIGDFSGRQIASVAEQLGWEYDRTAGDHMIYERPGMPLNLSIPNQRSVAPGTLRALIRKMGLTVPEFLALARK